MLYFQATLPWQCVRFNTHLLQMNCNMYMMYIFLANSHIGVASCGALGHVRPPRLPTVWFIWSLQTRTILKLVYVWLPTHKRKGPILAYSFVTVHCMNFIIFLCVTLKLFHLTFMPLLVPNPGDASYIYTTIYKHYTIYI